ncbi:MAG: glycosyltransferase family protein [Magnetospirillum sp. WYHS-4]
MTTAAIVQARLGSTRLPGKVLLDLGGVTVLARVLERCRAVPGVDRVVCAVPDNAADDPVAAEAERCGVPVCRGSETDVLDRYRKAAEMAGADVILRVTSDCPLIDPEVCGQVLALRAATDAAYACNNMPATWPHGLDCEAFPRAWLEGAAREAVKPSEREHVGPFIRNHPEARKANLPCPDGDHHFRRWTLDHPEDYAFLKEIYARLPAGPAAFAWKAALAVVLREPELARINAGFDPLEGLKKSLAADRRAGHSQE